ncbi:signal peptidase II [Balneolales bacterium ANBcel1]|nr:signal peptidase II [Balneolales bacterium ANBcel1]
MNSSARKLTLFGGVALAVLIIDQITKFQVRTTPELHNYTVIEGWLAFNFTKNPGMALGIHWAETWVISLIAIAAMFIILAYVWKTLKPAGTGYLICMGMIVGGALGNITDRLFQARIGGYGSFLDGHVVDFIHFKLNVGGFDVFPYIFNVADSAISVAIVTLIVFHRKLLPEYTAREQEQDAPQEPVISGGEQDEVGRPDHDPEEKPDVSPDRDAH